MKTHFNYGWTTLSLVLVLFFGNAGATTLNVPVPYGTIQAAVDAAIDGDTIIVSAGLYPESIDINVKVSIEGAGSGTNPAVDTIIDPVAGNGMYIHQPVNLKNLRIADAPGNGIRVQKTGTDPILLFNNVTWENVAAVGNGIRGVELHNGTTVSNMTIINCKFNNNYQQGLRTSSQTPVEGVTIVDSEFNGNSYGIYHNALSKDITISGCTFDNNYLYGMYMSEYGKMQNISISNSSLSGNTRWGFVFWSGHSEGINGVSITGTTINNNGLGAWIGADSITDFEITDSYIMYNTYGDPNYYEGINFSYGTLTNAAIHNSFITGNLGQGVSNTADGIVDATFNWWGDISGPLHQTSWEYMGNPYGPNYGTGDGVTDYILYEPWLDYSDLYPCGNPGQNRVAVCHKGKSLCISEEDVAEHLAHGDYLGECE